MSIFYKKSLKPLLDDESTIWHLLELFWEEKTENGLHAIALIALIAHVLPLSQV